MANPSPICPDHFTVGSDGTNTRCTSSAGDTPQCDRYCHEQSCQDNGGTFVYENRNYFCDNIQREGIRLERASNNVCIARRTNNSEIRRFDRDPSCFTAIATYTDQGFSCYDELPNNGRMCSRYRN